MISAREFAEWMAFWKTDPPEDIKRQYENANLCNLLVSVNSTKKNKFKLNDFLLEYGKKEHKIKFSSREEVIAKLLAWKGIVNGSKQDS